MLWFRWYVRWSLKSVVMSAIKYLIRQALRLVTVVHSNAGMFGITIPLKLLGSVCTVLQSKKVLTTGNWVDSILLCLPTENCVIAALLVQWNYNKCTVYTWLIVGLRFCCSYWYLEMQFFMTFYFKCKAYIKIGYFRNVRYWQQLAYRTNDTTVSFMSRPCKLSMHQGPSLTKNFGETGVPIFGKHS